MEATSRDATFDACAAVGQPPPRHRPGRAVQGTFDELGTPLCEVTFVVVDLETTGGSPTRCAITEIGAVKVRGGHVLGEFQTLVDPGEPIPAFIQVLTGITDAMVSSAPRLSVALPAFLEFADDAVLVAHNAPFDIGFLRAGAAELGLGWTGPKVLDTVQLARQLVSRDEAPNRKLATLAALFGAQQSPDHRALHDARATVDVLHALIGRVGNLGVMTLDELLSFNTRVSPAQRRKRHLAEHLPSSPGVYLFKDAHGRVLYVGTSRDIRRRVRTYFTASEHRTRMGQMVALAQSVTAVECATPLEAQVRELRLIAEHDPRFNRRSRRPGSRPWVKLTAEPFPRLAIVRSIRADGATYAGPFPGRRAAELAIAALHEALPLRRCTTPIRRTPGTACALAEMGRCGAPCAHRQSREEYARVAGQASLALAGDGRGVVSTLEERLSFLASAERYEEAAITRDRLLALLRGAARSQRIAPLAAIPELIAARREPMGGWEIVSVRHGRLAGCMLTPRGADPMPHIAMLRLTAEVVTSRILPAPAATCEETELIAAWLERAEVRLVQVDGEWSSPAYGASGTRTRLELGARTGTLADSGPLGMQREAVTDPANRGQLVHDRPVHAGV